MMRFIAAACALGVTTTTCYLLQVTKPRYVELVRTVPVSGRQEEMVEGRFLRGLVDRVQFARTLRIRDRETDRIFSTGGLWAVVTVRLEATVKPVSLYRRVWQSQTGVVFDESRRLQRGLTMDFTVGQVNSGRLIFEIAKEQAGAATLRLSRDWITEFDSELRIDLDAGALGPDGQPAVSEMLDLRGTGNES